MSESRIGESSNSSNNNSFNSSFNTNSFNNTINYVSNVNNSRSADERTEILEWLSPLDPWIRHHDIGDHRVEHVGDWLLRTEEYRNWVHGTPGQESGNSALFCYGDPGAGKTYVTSLVIDSLCDWARERNATVACFYFDFAVQKEQSSTTVLRSLLKQVVNGLENIPPKIVGAFRDRKKATGGQRLGLGQVIEMLQDIASARPTFICFDALDECVVEYRGKLLDSLEQILHKSPNTRIFLAGRSHIRDEVEKHLAGRVAAVSITPTKADIIRFLRAKLGEDTTPEAMDNSSEEDIIKSIPEKVSELFLLVSLNIEAILRETTLHRRREKLDTMTNGLGLGGAYDATIGRIKAQGGDRSRLGMAALMWTSHSERPLSVDELCYALAVETGSSGINNNNIPSTRTVLGCCQGLVAVDKGSSTVRLIHFTLKEYLSRHADLFDKPHSSIAETCLTYLNSQAIKDSYFHGKSLREYASLYWGTHMRIECSDQAKTLALDFLAQSDNHISIKLLWQSIAKWYFDLWRPFSPLHCVSYFGIAEVTIDLIKTKKWDVNERDSVGMTPLMWAAWYGREEAVKLLLQQKHIKPDMRDGRFGKTALSWAAGSGREGVVRLFLSRLFINPGSIGRLWGMPLVMSLLFGRKYVNPDRPDNYGQTPLSFATEEGHEGVVKLLLEREDVSPDRLDNDGLTLLSWAAKNGREGVVKLLLEREDVSPDRPDSYGRTPLSWAARNERGGVVKMLLGQEDVSPDRPDNDGRTPLSWATQNRSEVVVKLLLEREDVNPDRPDNYGRTPLSQAAKYGREGVVKLLLELEDVSPDRLDNYGQTPLSWAAENGREGVVKLLLEREDVCLDKPDNNGRAPLSWAARSGREGVMKLLLEREDISPDRPDSYGRTPLSWAARNGNGQVVMLLLEREDVSPDRPDNHGQTPLMWAAARGCEGVVKLLLKREDVCRDRPDNDGLTPLLWATRYWHNRTAELLRAPSLLPPS